MWNLYLAVTGGDPPASAPAVGEPLEAASYMQCTLIIIGVILLTIWMVRRLRRPGKFSLRDTPGRPNTLTAVHVIPLFLFWQLVGESTRYLLDLAPLEPTQANLLAGAMRQVVCIPVLLVVGHWTFRHGLVRGMGLSMRHWAFDSLRGAYGYLAVFPLCIGMARLFEMLVMLVNRQWCQPHSLLVTLKDVSAGWKVVVVLSAVVFTPLVEEILFRGYLQSMLRRYLRSPWHAVLLTSGIFALFHYPTPQYIPALFLLSLALGYNYERCGRLWPAILLHGLFNGVMILLQLLG